MKVPTAFSIMPERSKMPNIIPLDNTTKMMDMADANPPGIAKKVSRNESGVCSMAL